MVIVQKRDVLAGAVAAGIIPLAIDVGFFIDYYLQKRKRSRIGLEVGAGCQVVGSASVTCS